MLVLVCGMHRSGSTLTWQITRLLLDGRPGLRNPRDVSPEEFVAAAADPNDLLMAKVHYRPNFAATQFPREGAIYLYTYRDVRDAIASLYRKGRYAENDPRRGVRSTRKATKREIAGDALWTSMPGVWIAKYEDFRDDVPGLVRSLAAVLGVEVSPERVDAICAEVDIEAQRQRVQQARVSGVDEDTRITQNHITDGREGAWRETLTAAEVGAVEIESGAWLATRGYEVATKQGRLSIARARRRSADTTAPGAGSSAIVTVPPRETVPAAAAAPTPSARSNVVIPHARQWAILLAVLTFVGAVASIGFGTDVNIRIVLTILTIGFAGACGIVVGRVQQHRQKQE